MKDKERIVRIGGATGGETDGAIGLRQLSQVATLDYVILDYLSEPSMAPLGKLAEADPASGFLSDFLDVHVAPNLRELKRNGIRLVSNAGGVNPQGAAKAIEAVAAAQGIDIKVAAITGDDIRPMFDELRSEGHRDMFYGQPFPDSIRSMNAYCGAFPIAHAFDLGADIVLTGRVVDSALILGPLIHEFGWKPDDYDLLAGGTVAGHLLECGGQVTGGTFTDWESVPDYSRPSYPIGECHADGSVVITKTEESGGLVSVGTVSEQLLYEVSDPQTYFVPDVVCDMSDVTVEEIAPNRVLVSGARGYPPTGTYKVCTTYADGWRSTSMTPIIGIDAERKARARADALIDLTSRMLRDANLGDWKRTDIEVVGSDAGYGDRALKRTNREVICKIVVEHDDPRAAELFWREERASQMFMMAGTASSVSMFLSAPRIQPVNRLFSFLLDKNRVPITVHFDGRSEPFDVPTGGGFDMSMIRRPEVADAPDDGDASVPLIALAWGRSGDKGNLFNVAVVARKPEYLPYIRKSVTPSAVGAWYAHFLKPGTEARVDRYDAPGSNALNFVVHESLKGGVASGSPLLDRSAKGMAQQLLEFPVLVPARIAAEVWPADHPLRSALDWPDGAKANARTGAAR